MLEAQKAEGARNLYQVYLKSTRSKREVKIKHMKFFLSIFVFP